MINTKNVICTYEKTLEEKILKALPDILLPFLMVGAFFIFIFSMWIVAGLINTYGF